MGRMDSSAVVNGRVVFSDEEDEDDIYNDDFYKDEEDDLWSLIPYFIPRFLVCHCPA